MPLLKSNAALTDASPKNVMQTEYYGATVVISQCQWCHTLVPYHDGDVPESKAGNPDQTSWKKSFNLLQVPKRWCSPTNFSWATLGLTAEPPLERPRGRAKRNTGVKGSKVENASVALSSNASQGTNSAASNRDSMAQSSPQATFGPRGKALGRIATKWANVISETSWTASKRPKRRRQPGLRPPKKDPLSTEVVLAESGILKFPHLLYNLLPIGARNFIFGSSLHSIQPLPMPPYGVLGIDSVGKQTYSPIQTSRKSSNGDQHSPRERSRRAAKFTRPCQEDGGVLLSRASRELAEARLIGPTCRSGFCRIDKPRQGYPGVVDRLDRGGVRSGTPLITLFNSTERVAVIDMDKVGPQCERLRGTTMSGCN
ncbi:hypothetical protein CIRG_06071 [Coccidioides immitis RMSCC 2394]|uniref:Uncharacterized protein n=1 Tax=Coccidioides immitis RMSCC 2394 TaxID=404692 RepID=A0A0J6YFC6_COCIT|nr:hypothetical protein CIRG_06071 [Coccidioides immitis RMSCC 2394]